MAIVQQAMAIAPDYARARAAFVHAAQQAGARVQACVHPERGLHGEELAMDVAWLGPPQADKVLVSLSATHGVEGVYGSGAQVHWLRTQGLQPLPPQTAVMLVHALNPHGFSWLRRVNEDNVDINRNHLDFSRPLPSNPDYEAIHALVVPAQLHAQTLQDIHAQLQAHIARVGLSAATRAITGGQYVHADGLFYGGRQLCWSNRMLNAVVAAHLTHARALCVLDHHTGLGPHAHSELICRHPVGSPALQHARDWWGADVTSPAAGESASEVIDGNVRMAFESLCPQAQVVAIAVEVGTVPGEQVLAALIADNLLHLRDHPRSALGEQVRAQVRKAFFDDSPAWQTQCISRAMQIYQQGLQGLQALVPAHA